MIVAGRVEDAADHLPNQGTVIFLRAVVGGDGDAVCLC